MAARSEPSTPTTTTRNARRGGASTDGGGGGGGAAALTTVGGQARAPGGGRVRRRAQLAPGAHYYCAAGLVWGMPILSANNAPLNTLASVPRLPVRCARSLAQYKVPAVRSTGDDDRGRRPLGRRPLGRRCAAHYCRRGPPPAGDLGLLLIRTRLLVGHWAYGSHRTSQTPASARFDSWVFVSAVVGFTMKKAAVNRCHGQFFFF